MKEIKLNALVLRAVDYNEYDKMLTLLSSEEGKISAGIKGVRRPNAKLRFAAQPFCFAEYILVKSGDRYTVKNASENESFYDLRCDIEKFYAACAVLEAASAFSFSQAEAEGFFSESVKALMNMCQVDAAEPLTAYLIYVLERSGYGLSVSNCPICGKPLERQDDLRFNMNQGEFVCGDCGEGVRASSATYNVLRKVQGKSFQAERISDDGKKRALRLLREYCALKCDAVFKSLSEYIRLKD